MTRWSGSLDIQWRGERLIAKFNCSLISKSERRAISIKVSDSDREDAAYTDESILHCCSCCGRDRHTLNANAERAMMPRLA